MKIKTLNKSNNKLIQLQITKLYYKKNFYNSKTNLKHIEILLNKISNIIYLYNIKNKKILFIGFPASFGKTLKNTQHLSIPESIWINGMLSNRGLSKVSRKEKSNIPFHMFKSRFDLIVVYNLDEKSTAIEESYFKRIPVISFNMKLNVFNLKTTYKSLGNYSLINDKMENNSFFFSFIESTLNREKKTSKLKRYEKF